MRKTSEGVDLYISRAPKRLQRLLKAILKSLICAIDFMQKMETI